jgi:hypothetical protein
MGDLGTGSALRPGTTAQPGMSANIPGCEKHPSQGGDTGSNPVGTTRRSPVQGPTLAPETSRAESMGRPDHACLARMSLASSSSSRARVSRSSASHLLHALPMQLKVTAHDHRVVGTSTSRTSAAGIPWRRSVARARSRTSRKAPGSTASPLATSARRACEDAWARPDLKCQGVTITTRPFPKASVVAYSTPSGATSTAAGSVTSTSTDASPSTIWEI